MSKVLIDRELLERILGKMSIVWQRTDETEELREILAQPAAEDCGLEVVAFGYGKTVLWNQTDGPDVAWGEQLCRKSDADARDAMRLERIASLDSDARFFYGKMSDAEHANEQLRAELAALKSATVVMPAEAELIAFAVEEQFLLFCDEDEFVQIAAAVLHKFARLNRSKT